MNSDNLKPVSPDKLESCKQLGDVVVKAAETQLTDTPDWDTPGMAAFEQAHLLHRDATLADVITRSRGRLCYLATPYSKVAVGADGEWDPNESLECAMRAARWARLLALDGVTAVSPIIQAVEMLRADVIDRALDPLDGRFWENWCRPLLVASSVVIVPPIPGWAESDGIWIEAYHALRTNRCVFLIKDGEYFGGAE